MLLAPHVVASMALADQVDTNVIILTIILVVFYFFLELIPHIEPEDATRKSISKKNIKTAFVIDFIGSLGIIFLVGMSKWFYNNSNIETVDSPYYFIFGGFVSFILYLSFHHGTKIPIKIDILNHLNKVHHKIRRLDPSIWGVAVQFSVLIISIAFLFDAIEFFQIEQMINRFVLF